MRVAEEPVCVNLFLQKPVFTSLHLKSPVHVHRLWAKQWKHNDAGWRILYSEAVVMNGRFQMQGGKNWFLPKEMNANRFFWDSHWLEIWSNHFYPSMGPNGGSVLRGYGLRETIHMTHQGEMLRHRARRLYPTILITDNSIYLLKPFTSLHKAF